MFIDDEFDQKLTSIFCSAPLLNSRSPLVVLQIFFNPSGKGLIDRTMWGRSTGPLPLVLKYLKHYHGNVSVRDATVTDVLLLHQVMMTMVMYTGTDADADCTNDDDMQTSSGEVESCVHSIYGCCPDGVTARQTDDDDDACLTSTSSTWPTSPHKSTTSKTWLTSPHQSTSARVTSNNVTSQSQTTVVMTTVAIETSSSATTAAMDTASATAAMETTASVDSSSDHVTEKDESEGPVTSLGTDREPAYRMTSSRTSDVTTVTTTQWTTRDDDTMRRGAC